MKSILIALAAVILMASCSPEPDNVIHNKVVSAGEWKFDSVQNKNVQEEIIAYVVSPTYSQAHNYAYKSGQALFTVLSILLLIAAGYLFYLRRDGKEFNVIFIWAALALSAACLETKPLSIWLNNYKTIPKTEYDSLINKDGNIKAFWDKKWEDNVITWGAHK